MSASGPSDDRRTLGSGADVDVRARVGDAIRTLIDVTALTTGARFFTTLVRELAGTLAVPHALIAECIDLSNTRVRTLAFWSDGRFLDNSVYGFADNKCGVDISGAESYYGVALFNARHEVIGHLAILDAAPLQGETIEGVMRACAAIASRELERERVTNSITSLKDEIARLNAERDRAYMREIVGSATAEAAPSTTDRPVISGTLEDVERAHIVAVLAQTGWVIEGPRGAARILDLHPNTLRSRLKRLGLERARHGLPPVEGV